jgi:hypothetical protein
MLNSAVRYQIFVSSTFHDLQDERREVMQALLEMDCIPAGMELFPATDDDSWTLITKVIDLSDYYVVIVGGRYGSVDASGISFTEKEYDYACESGIPVLAFVHGDPKKIPSGKTELDPEARKRLDSFRDKILKKHHAKKWVSASELGSVVSRSLIRSARDNPRVGWVRGDMAATAEQLEERARLQKEVVELRGALRESTSGAPEGTADLQQGDDLIPLELRFDGYTKANWRMHQRHEPSEESSWTTECFTWNEALAALGPTLLEEASERDMKIALRIAVEREIKKMHAKKVFGINNIKLHPDMFDTVKIQFVALGLIESGAKKRGVSDNAVYWRLTPHGRTTLMKLRALRRDAEDHPSGSDGQG